MIRTISVIPFLLISCIANADINTCVPEKAQQYQAPKPYDTVEITNRTYYAIKSLCDYIYKPTPESYEQARLANFAAIELVNKIQSTLPSLQPVSEKLTEYLKQLTNDGQYLLPVTPIIKTAFAKIEFDVSVDDSDNHLLKEMKIDLEKIKKDYDSTTPEAISCFNMIKEDNNCRQAVDATSRVLQAIFMPLRDAPIDRLRSVDIFNKAWDEYFTTAREQTYFDIAATQLLYSVFVEENHEFVGPPNFQVFFMRPNIVVENVGAAVDGDEISEALALELFGINFWQEDSCGFFSCGVSLTLNYADRAGVKSSGYGLMFHIENKYSIGVTKHGDDNGIFVTVDLLKFFQDKKETLKRFRN